MHTPTVTIRIKIVAKALISGDTPNLTLEKINMGNVVAPGPIVTDMLAALTDDQQATYAEAVPLGRLGQVHEIAAAVTFLASEDAGYVTGAVLPVDGGLCMG